MSQLNPEQTSMLSKEKGEKFFEVTSFPRSQYLASMLARGVMNVSQIVQEGDRYFSHKQRLETLPPHDDAPAQFIADGLILHHVFQDSDHGLHDDPKRKNKTLEFKNVVFDKDMKRYSIFDVDAFEGAKSYFNVLTTDGEEFKESIKKWLTEDASLLTEKDSQTAIHSIATVLAKKVDQFLENNFKDKSLLDAAFQKAFPDSNLSELDEYFSSHHAQSLSVEEKKDLFFKDLITRLSLTREVAKELVEQNKK